MEDNSRHRKLSRPAGDPRIALLKELADPLRLRIVDRLGHGGPATVTRLAAEEDVPLPQLSNHLRRLRAAGLVSSHRAGRQVIYELADPRLEQLLPLLDSLTGRVVSRWRTETAVPELPSRTCYDHLAGRIGVGLYAALRDRGALRPRPDGLVELGPSATAAFQALGVELDRVCPRGHQRLAFECLDATERAPHLAGALADALARSLFARAWVQRQTPGRTIVLTPAGRRGLRAAVGLGVDPAPASG